MLCCAVLCAGISLARLLWHVPVPAMVTLIASLLLERRVLVVGQSRDMVSAAVLAAQALIHPFRWAAADPAPQHCVLRFPFCGPSASSVGRFAAVYAGVLASNMASVWLRVG